MADKSATDKKGTRDGEKEWRKVGQREGVEKGMDKGGKEWNLAPNYLSDLESLNTPYNKFGQHIAVGLHT